MTQRCEFNRWKSKGTVKCHDHTTRFSIPRACSYYWTSVTRVFLLTLGNKKFLPFNGIYYDNSTLYKETNIKSSILQPKKPQNVRHNRSTNMGRETENFQKSQRQRPGGGTGVPMKSSKCQIREDERIFLVVLLIMVRPQRSGCWDSGRAPARHSCGVVGVTSLRGAWMCWGATRSSL